MVEFTFGSIRVCPYGGGLCYSRSCDSLEGGECVLCGRHGNPNGRFMKRVVNRDFSGFSFVVSPKRWRGALR